MLAPVSISNVNVAVPLIARADYEGTALLYQCHLTPRWPCDAST